MEPGNTLFSGDTSQMDCALELARIAAAAGEVPIGAIVVSPEGIIIGRGKNAVESMGTQRAHAEMLALEDAAISTGNWRLSGCILYVTLEPCMMCIGMAILSRVSVVVYGATSPLFGSHLDTDISSPVYRSGSIQLVGGVRAQEAAELLRDFFQKKRKKSE